MYRAAVADFLPAVAVQQEIPAEQIQVGAFLLLRAALVVTGHVAQMVAALSMVDSVAAAWETTVQVAVVAIVAVAVARAQVVRALHGTVAAVADHLSVALINNLLVQISTIFPV
jgi:hypothetical protein